ncbi:MAG: ABC transporter ATP-binding protein [Christensenellales bacterium]|jgi:ATP-binding cassette subfamily B multidrug efflux pump
MSKDKRPDMRQRGPMGGGPFGMLSGGKAKNFKKSLVRLIRYLRPQLFTLIIVLLLAVIGTGFTIATPKVLAKATNALQTGIMKGSIDMEYIVKIIITVIIMYILAAVFSFISLFISAGMAQKVVYYMRNDIKNKLARLSVSYYDKTSTGDILSRITNDVDLIATSLQQSITQVITSVISIIGIFIMMLTISGWMTLITIGTLPLFILITINIARKSQKKFSEQQKVLGELNGKIEENVAGQKIIKLYGREQDTIEDFETSNERLMKVGAKAQFFAGMIMPTLQFVNNLGFVAVCVVGGILAGRPSPLMIGDIQAFIQYSHQFSHPIMNTANIANVIQSTVAAAERIFELLDSEEEPADAAEPESIKDIQAQIEFQNVNFSYTQDKPLITDMNIDVKPGDRIAIVGPTGAGKTTLVNLLMRFYEINSGRITVGGYDQRDFNKDDLRSLYGMVLQDTWLFSGTIRDNIAYGKPGATEEEIKEAARKAHVDFFIDTLPDGYDTVLNEEVTNISEGQKQLLTIARAILSDNKILILDEATSSVDTRTEYYIQNAMTQMMKGKTSFIIAHRLSTIKAADLILVMDKGAIVEQGTHEQLLEKNGFYSDLYNSQF